MLPNLYQHHNNHYEFEEKKVAEKIDGIFAHTMVIQNKDDSIKINRFGGVFGNTYFYNDENNDGLVDRIYMNKQFSRGPKEYSLERNQHFGKYQQIFQEADRDFKNQMERFKSYL